MTSEQRTLYMVWFSLAGVISSVALVWSHHVLEAGQVSAGTFSSLAEMLLIPCYFISYSSLVLCLLGGIITALLSVNKSKKSLRHGLTCTPLSLANLAIIIAGGASLSA